MAELKKKHVEIKVKNIREFNLSYWEIDSGKEGPCFLLTAALHGNEVMGCEVMRRFCPVAKEKLVRGKIILVPFSNPPALWRRRHHVYSPPCEPKGRGQDNMNRIWPGNPDGHEIEQFAYIFNEALVKQATHNIDMHCWTRFNVTASLPDDDEKQVEFARAAALPAMRILKKTVKVSSARQGSPENPCTLTDLFVSTGRVSFSMEFSGQYIITEKEVKTGVRMLSNCSKYLGMIEGELEGMDERTMCIRDNAQFISVTAPENGLFIENGLQVGDFVRKGDKLGVLFSDSTLEAQDITAPADGGLYTYGCHRKLADVDLADRHPYADKGDLLSKIVTD